METGDVVPVHFSPKETGWARYLGNGEFAILNIPISTPHNLHDVVKGYSHPKLNKPILDTKILSREYYHKNALAFDDMELLNKIVDRLKEEQMSMELLFHPKKDQNGLMVVCHNNPKMFQQILEEETHYEPFDE
jgi:hypothetical protein